jgi:hypothetical protein
MSQAEEKTVQKDGYELTFYPGFASRATVRNGEGEVELYKQEETYHLPKGEKKPKTKYRIALKGGKKKQSLTLDVNDPELRVKRITVELYDENHVAGAGEGGETAETLTVDNDPRYCPPYC